MPLAYTAENRYRKGRRGLGWALCGETERLHGSREVEAACVRSVGHCSCPSQKCPGGGWKALRMTKCCRRLFRPRSYSRSLPTPQTTTDSPSSPVCRLSMPTDVFSRTQPRICTGGAGRSGLVQSGGEAARRDSGMGAIARVGSGGGGRERENGVYVHHVCVFAPQPAHHLEALMPPP